MLNKYDTLESSTTLLSEPQILYYLQYITLDARCSVEKITFQTLFCGLTFWRRTFFQILAHPVFKM